MVPARRSPACSVPFRVSAVERLARAAGLPIIGIARLASRTAPAFGSEEQLYGQARRASKVVAFSPRQERPWCGSEAFARDRVAVHCSRRGCTRSPARRRSHRGASSVGIGVAGIVTAANRGFDIRALATRSMRTAIRLTTSSRGSGGELGERSHGRSDEPPVLASEEARPGELAGFWSDESLRLPARVRDTQSMRNPIALARARPEGRLRYRGLHASEANQGYVERVSSASPSIRRSEGDQPNVLQLSASVVACLHSVAWLRFRRLAPLTCLARRSDRRSVIR
jgi:hypothetical protein